MQRLNEKELTGPALIKSLDKAGKDVDALRALMIDAGRGHETTREILSKDDPLSLEFKAAVENYILLSGERAYRLKQSGKLHPVRHL